jgi:hypothetical protein
VTRGQMPSEDQAVAETYGTAATTNVPRLGLMLAPGNDVAGSGGKGVVVVARRCGIISPPRLRPSRSCWHITSLRAGMTETAIEWWGKAGQRSLEQSHEETDDRLHAPPCEIPVTTTHTGY